MELTLKDKATSGSTEITLQVAQDEDGAPQLVESRAPTIPPRQSQGTIDAGHFDPETDFVWQMDDWSGGALEPYYRPGSNKYAISNGIDARIPGAMILLPPPGASRTSTFTTVGRQAENAHVDMGLQNHGAHYQATTDWTADNSTTLTVITTDVIDTEDSYQFQLVTSGSLSNQDSIFHQDLTNPTVMRNKTVSFTVTPKQTAGSDSAKVYIDDGVGITYSSSSITGVQEQITVTRTINGGATRVRLGISADGNEGGTNTYVIDTALIFIGTLATTVDIVGTAYLTDALYLAAGPAVYKWNNTVGSERWDVVFVGTANATDIIEFEGNIYVAFGSGVAYVYGSDTTWTARATGDTDAIFFAVARNGAGAHALWKSDANNKVRNTTDGTEAGAAWSSQIDVGASNFAITHMYGVFDSVVIGKEDGLYAYRRFDLSSSAGDNLFENVSPDWTSVPDTKNFKRGALWGGWLWLSVQGGFVRWRPGSFQILTRLFINQQVTAEPFDIIGVWGSPQQLLVSTRHRLYSVQVRGDEFFIHTMYEYEQAFELGSTGALGYDIDDESLFIFGGLDVGNSTNTYVGGYRYLMNKDLLSAGFDSIAYLGSSPSGDGVQIGTLDTSIWHGGMISAPKAYVSLTMLLAGATNGTIVVSFALDGSTTFTTLGTFSALNISTVYFHVIASPETNAVGRTIQLRFQHTFNTASLNTQPLYMLGFSLHSTLRLDRLRTWEIDIVGSDHSITDGGMEAPESFSEILAALNTLELQEYPIVMNLDTDEDGVIETTTVYLRDVQRKRTSEDEEVISLLIQEAKTSA